MNNFDQWMLKNVPAAFFASQEAAYSGLPGRTNGPADAYRHLLWSAELARIYGVDAARKILSSHEMFDFNSGSQTLTEHNIDYHNNELGLSFGGALNSSGGGSQLDVINWARSQIISGYNLPNQVDINNNNSTYGSGVTWAITSQWSANPTYIGSQKQATVSASNWPPTFPSIAAWSDTNQSTVGRKRETYSAV